MYIQIYILVKAAFFLEGIQQSSLTINKTNEQSQTVTLMKLTKNLVISSICNENNKVKAGTYTFSLVASLKYLSTYSVPIGTPILSFVMLVHVRHLGSVSSTPVIFRLNSARAWRNSFVRKLILSLSICQVMYFERILKKYALIFVCEKGQRKNREILARPTFYTILSLYIV